MRQMLLSLVCVFSLAGCGSSHVAPVVEGWHKAKSSSSIYRVQKGDTLYSIAFAFDQDYHDLAARNGLSTHSTLYVGQSLRMRGSERHLPVSKKVSHKRVSKPARVAEHKRPKYRLADSRVRRHSPDSPVKGRAHTEMHSAHYHYRPTRKLHWRWPSRGKIISQFTGSYEGNRGVDIKSYYGSSIRAAASGVVVYVGHGVRGYPNLVILKHNRHYLSAYSNNAKILVRQGDTVHSGQLIAKMGRDKAGRTRLHFELRRNGQPINPRRVLPRRRV